MKTGDKIKVCGFEDDNGIVVTKEKSVEDAIVFCGLSIKTANSLRMHNKAYVYSAIKSSLRNLNIT